MTFLFLDRVAGIVGEPDSLVGEARARIFKEPVRHEGLRRLPRDEVRAHVASVVVRVANDRLRQPLMDAVSVHAEEAAVAHEMCGGEPEGLRDAVIEAFAGNDVGIDMSVFEVGEATPEAVADQVLSAPSDWMTVEIVTERAGVTREMLDGIVDEILAPEFAPTEWSLLTLALAINGNAAFADAGDSITEATGYILSDDAALRATGFQLVGIAPTEELTAWLDERAMFSSPEQDEADVAEVLRLINQKGGGSHNSDGGDAGDMTAAGAEQEQPAPAAAVKPTVAELQAMFDDPTPYETFVKDDGSLGARPAKPQAPVAAEPSDVTRAVAAALKTLFDHTKETDVHMAEILGVPKAVVAQARKDVTPWSPDADQMGSLRALVGRYNDALAAAAGALNALEGL